ncbi:MAG TPA: ABC transporter substrate-binding protein, partial [Sporichthya sp.]|nr:ABC transporter substrate-binding protein [Sporichthya sp.]
PCTKVLDPILLGQNGTFSGFLQGSLGGFRPGMAAWAADVNARGGIQCHPVKLFQVDDGSNPAKTVSNTKDLIENKHVIAMVGAVVPFNITSYRSVVDPAKIPTLGGDNVDLGWDEDPYMFPTGVTVLPGMALGMKSSAERTGKRKFAVVYCVEASACASVHQASTELAKQAGVEIVNQQSISLTQTDYTSNCQTAKNAGADSVLAVFDSSALQRFFRSCAAIGYFPPSATIGLAVGAAAASDPNVQKSTVTVTPTNAPYFNTFTPGVAEFQRVMKRYAPGAVLDNSSMSAFTSGKLLEAALGKVASEARSGPVTTEMILKGLHLLKNERLAGLSATPITYKAGQANKLPACAFVTVVQAGGITDPLKGKSVCLAGAQAQSIESQSAGNGSADPSAVSKEPTAQLMSTETRPAASVGQLRQRKVG